jgi:hypothetical protein
MIPPRIPCLCAIVLTAAFVSSCREARQVAPSVPASPAPATQVAATTVQNAAPALPETPVATSQAVDPAAPAQAVPDVNCDSLMPVILELEGRLFATPRDAGLMRQFARATYDTASGSLYLAGKGVADPRADKATWESARQRAASIDAQRWALYAKAWHTGDKRAFGRKIRGDVSYTRACAEKLVGDTLYQMIQVPVGSVTVR